MKQLLRNADYVLTLDESTRTLRNASVLIEDAHIVETGDAADLDRRHRASLAPVNVIDLTGSLLSPGFINTHARTMEHLSRGLIPDNLPTLPGALRYFFPLQFAMTEDDAYASARLCCLDMHGTTGFIDPVAESRRRAVQGCPRGRHSDTSVHDTGNGDPARRPSARLALAHGLR